MQLTVGSFSQESTVNRNLNRSTINTSDEGNNLNLHNHANQIY